MQAEIATKPIVKEPADQMIVGINRAFVRATSSKNQRRHFEVILGRIEPIGDSSKVFAAVRDLDDLARERVRSALRGAGRGPATKLTVSGSTLAGSASLFVLFDLLGCASVIIDEDANEIRLGSGAERAGIGRRA